MAFFAHYDDETIAIGARLRRFAAAHFVHITDSAPRDEEDSRAGGFASLSEYRRAREEEFRSALDVAGMFNLSSECLNIPDQEASFCLADLTFRILKIIENHRPEVVFTHPYEGGHPDHDACAFGVHHASELIEERNSAPPLIVEAAFYHAGPNGITTGSFLPSDHPAEEVRCLLSPEERRRKQRLLACFSTQQNTLKYFGVEQESFRIAPRYDFQKPPYAPPVFYDGYSWGMNSHRFCQLAEAAEQDIQERASSPCR